MTASGVRMHPLTLVTLLAVVAASGPCRGAEALIVRNTALVAPPAPACQVHATVLHRGDTLGGALAHWRVSQTQALNWNARLPTGKRARDLRPGDRVIACLTGPATSRRLLGLEIRTRHGGKAVLGQFPKPAPATSVVAALFKPPTVARPAERLRRIDFRLEGPLDGALEERHLPGTEIDAIHAWLHADADLPVDLPAGTRVGLLLGQGPDDGVHLLRLRIWYRGETHDLFSYVDANDRRWVLDRAGMGILHLPLQTPVDYTRVSSGWGWREQPVEHVPEFHKGIDYAAPLGTAVRAAAGGMVKFRGRRGNYGRLVIIELAPGTQTRYGHLSRIAAGLRAGSHVKAGQVIGYVGSTGLSTGPHLYFELWMHHLRVDPLTARLNLPVRLAGPVLQAFNRYVGSIDDLQSAFAGAG